MAAKTSPTADMPASMPTCAGIDRAGDDAADAGNQRLLVAEADDAGRGADDVDHVAEADVGADRVPMRVEGADGNRNARGQA